MFGMVSKIARPFVSMGQKVGSGLAQLGSKVRPVMEQIYHSLAGFMGRHDGLARGMVGKEKIIEDVAEVVGGAIGKTYLP